MAVRRKASDLDVSTQGINTDGKQQLPSFAFHLQLLLYAEKPIVQVNAETRQNFFLCYFHRLGMPLRRTVTTQAASMHRSMY